MSPRQQAWSLTNSSPSSMLVHSGLNGWAKPQQPWTDISHHSNASITRKWVVSFQRNCGCSCGICHVHNWHDYLHIKGHVFLFIGCRRISLSPSLLMWAYQIFPGPATWGCYIIEGHRAGQLFLRVHCRGGASVISNNEVDQCTLSQAANSLGTQHEF